MPRLPKTPLWSDPFARELLQRLARKDKRTMTMYIRLLLQKEALRKGVVTPKELDEYYA